MTLEKLSCTDGELKVYRLVIGGGIYNWKFFFKGYVRQIGSIEAWSVDIFEKRDVDWTLEIVFRMN